MTSQTAAADRAQIERYLSAPPRRLSFQGDLERAFCAERAERQRRAFSSDALAAILTVHLIATAGILAKVVTPDQACRAFLAIELILTFPTLALVWLTRRYAWLEAKSADLFVVVALLTLAAGVAINQTLVGAVALYHLFGLCIFPVKLNLRADLPFKDGAAMAAVYLPTLIANAFLHPGFDPAASWCAAILYVAITALSLSANYRMEASERRTYLSYVRETLRNAEIIDVNRRLEALSRMDDLTGLPNRRDFDERFAAAVEEARDKRTPLTVLMLDIDHFKLYNDTMGHPEGDKCIRAIARAVAQAVGEPPGFSGRVGGEEFAVALPGLGAEAAACVASRVRSSVQALHWPHPALGERRFVSVSLGVACLNPACPEAPEALLGRADAALYRAKRAGRDRAEIDLKVVGA